MKRILLKISGEALSSEKLAIDPVKVQGVAQMIQDVKGSGIELVIVL
jgi:uridylate kinase